MSDNLSLYQRYLYKSRQAEDGQTKFIDLFHYSLAAVLFTIYGIQVCPLLESISPFQLALPISLAWLARCYLLRNIESHTCEYQVFRQFTVDIGLFLCAGIALNLVNVALYGAPWHSILKVMVGVAILGLFVSVDLALLRERYLSQKLMQQQKSLNLAHRFTSFAQKFSLMATTVVVSISLVLFLVVNKDLDWLLSHENQLIPSNARTSILFEVAFIMIVLLAYSLRIIRSYVVNLKMYLFHQNSVLNEVMLGNLVERVPVTSQDEFGLMAHGTNAMIESLQQHHEELNVTRDVAVLALASLAETRDNETGAHILRTQRYVKALATHLSQHPDFKDELDEQTIDLLYKSAPLHDVGKVGVPDSILLKPGKLTDDEFEIMKTHAQLGADALKVAEARLGSNSFLSYAREISACHHEKWDGSGYPNQLKGNAIPLSARLMALADVYDALISKRVYKPAFDHEKAKAIILEGEGSHFDPRMVRAFTQCEDTFIAIAAEFKDRHEA